MKIAITDINIFIDLLEVDLLNFIFDIGYEIHTTLEVINELLEFNSNVIEIISVYTDKKTLHIKEFTSDEIDSIITLNLYKGLSFQDISLFYYATQKENFEVFTNDKLLSKTCLQQGIPIHGTLWILDKFNELQKITPIPLAQVLKKLMLRKDRFPIEECKKRLAIWQ